MSTFFISDLHLVETRPNSAAFFLRFLKGRILHADALYILGDFFDVWVGDDAVRPFHQELIQALRQVTDSGVPVYFMPGNRDFLIGKRFLKETGCQLLNDPSVIMLYDVPVLVMHGDLLCAQDRSYHLFRRFIRSGFIRWLALHLPLKLRWHIANKIRRASQRKNAHKVNSKHITDESVARFLSDYHVDYLIHGHTHQPDIHHIDKAIRAVLGAWEDKGSVLVCQSAEQVDRHLDFKLESIA